LRIPQVHSAILFHLREVASVEDEEYVLGTWLLASYDVDRQVSALVRRTWTDFVVLNTSGSTSTSNDKTQDKLRVSSKLLNTLLSFVQRAIYDPLSAYTYINPPPPAPAPPPQQSGPKKGPARTQGKTVSVPTKKKEVEEEPRRGDEEEERAEDRKARVRVGGLGALGWFLGTGYGFNLLRGSQRSYR
jgi:hypothetical protein